MQVRLSAEWLDYICQVTKSEVMPFPLSDVFCHLFFFKGTERDEIMQDLCVDKAPSPDPNQNQLSSGPLQVQKKWKQNSKCQVKGEILNLLWHFHFSTQKLLIMIHWWKDHPHTKINIVMPLVSASFKTVNSFVFNICQSSSLFQSK